MATDFEVGAKALKTWGLGLGFALWLVCTIVTMFCSGAWVLPFFLLSFGGGLGFLYLIISACVNISAAFKYMDMKKNQPRHYSLDNATSSTLYWVKRIEELGAKLNKEKGDA